MSSETPNEFFWQDMQATDNGSDLALQRMALDSFVTQDQSQQLSLQPEESSSPTGLSTGSVENANNNNSPGNSSQAVLPIGVINPDAIIPQTRSYTCRICQVTFPNKSAVTVHSRIHTNHEGKPYRCGFCNKGFSTNFYLKQHERIHNGQKPYKCPMCDHSFKQLSHVQQHVRTHTGVRPYKCHWPGCGKAFLQQSHLKSHIARHSPKPNNGVRPYKCHWPDCEKSFAQISNLKSHIARHTPKQKTPKALPVPEIAEVADERRAIALLPEKQEPIEAGDANSAGLMSPDVIGQAAAAANIVPVQVSLVGGDCESICPFLCPGCSKLYVREATFKKHLEECKTKLQMSISATAAALGIEPPPLPSPGGQVPSYVGDANAGLSIDITLQEEAHQGVGVVPAKKSRKNSKPRQTALVDASQQHQPVLEIVEMPLDVGLGNSSPHLSDASLGGDGNGVKQEMVNIPIDGSSTGSVMFRLPQHLLNAVGSSDDSSVVSASSINSAFSQVSYNQASAQMLDTSFLTNHQLVTSSTAVNLPVNVSQPLTSSRSVMISGANIDENDTAKQNHSKADLRDADGHSTINPSALRWQWDQPSAPRMNFP